MSVSIYDGTNDALNKIAGREDTSYWEGTQAQWDALSASEKAEWTGKYVIITDDEEDLSDRIIIEQKTIIENTSINANNYQTYEANVAKTGYKALGIVGYAINGSADICTMYAFFNYSANTVKIRVMNVKSSATTIQNILAIVLYVKS